MDEAEAEFGRIHVVKRRYEIETIAWPPESIKIFSTFRSALTWAKRNKFEIGEIS